MIINVRMLAFMNGEIRQVNIPDDTSENMILNEVFKFGQNDFQPLDMPSVSCGDVIEYNNELYVVEPVTFTKITVEQYNKLIGMSRRERAFFSIFEGTENGN